ncbi:MAG: hypothetical protein Q8Q59_11300 [Luteolibacter sp.]|nr:hypothetical protein [Luteolibacter sp.]
MDKAESREQRLMMAAPMDQMAKRKDKPMRLQTVPVKEKEGMARRGQEIRKTRDERRSIEVEGRKETNGKPEQEIKPTKVKRPASPIAGKSADHFPKNQAPPKPQRSPILEPKKETSDHQPDPGKTRPETKRQQETRGPETKKKPTVPQIKKISRRNPHAVRKSL